jgi:hypothetical protein
VAGVGDFDADGLGDLLVGTPPVLPAAGAVDDQRHVSARRAQPLQQRVAGNG